MCGIKPFMLLCVIGTVFASGCMSVRVTTDLKPEVDPVLKSPAGKFYVAGLKYSVEYENGEPKLDKVYGKKLLSLVRKECIKSYPLLFSQDSANSIPIWIDAKDAITGRRSPIWVICTVALAPLILPAPRLFDCDRDIEVTAGVWNGRDGMGGEKVRKDFCRAQHTWFSYTPLGLITMPGKSDFPKVSEAFNPGPFGYDDIPQVAQQIATVIAKLIATKEPVFWTAPILAPGVPDAVQALPTALPMPKESAAPL